MHKEHAEAQGLVQMEMEEMRTMLGCRFAHDTMQTISNLPKNLQETPMLAIKSPPPPISTTRHAPQMEKKAEGERR